MYNTLSIMEVGSTKSDKKRKGRMKMNVDRAAIGRRIREIRIKKKISQETLAEYADIGACGEVGRHERGRALATRGVF